MTYFSLALATIPVLVFLAAQDLKVRMIYSFPVLFLSGVWAAHSVILYKDNPIFVITAWSATIALFMAYKISGMWGDKWIRINGQVEEDSRREARQAMLDENKAILGDRYSADDGLMTVFRFVSGTATVYSFTEEPVTYQL